MHGQTHPLTPSLSRDGALANSPIAATRSVEICDFLTIQMSRVIPLSDTIDGQTPLNSTIAPTAVT